MQLFCFNYASSSSVGCTHLFQEYLFILHSSWFAILLFLNYAYSRYHFFLYCHGLHHTVQYTGLVAISSRGWWQIKWPRILPSIIRPVGFATLPNTFPSLNVVPRLAVLYFMWRTIISPPGQEKWNKEKEEKKKRKIS